MIWEHIWVAILVGTVFGVPGGVLLILWGHWSGKYDKLIEEEWKKKWPDKKWEKDE